MPSVLLQAGGAVSSLDQFFFIAVPYVVLAIFLYATIRRFVGDRFSYSSYSSQFLENRHQFFGAVPWHYGIIVLFFGHLIGFLFPKTVLWWNGVPARLYIIEISALIFALVALSGLVNALIRRLKNPRVLTVTTTMDFLILTLLLFQVFTGMYVAIFERWGSSWFATVASPYLWSLFKLNPQISAVAQLPLMVKLHILGAFAVFAVFPFTRLVHILVVPIPYLWRRMQVVIWNKKRA